MELLKSDLTELSLTDESPSTCALNLLLAANFMLQLPTIDTRCPGNLEVILLPNLRMPHDVLDWN